MVSPNIMQLYAIDVMRLASPMLLVMEKDPPPGVSGMGTDKAAIMDCRVFVSK